jgi:hypothetical protein
MDRAAAWQFVVTAGQAVSRRRAVLTAWLVLPALLIGAAGGLLLTVPLALVCQPEGQDLPWWPVLLGVLAGLALVGLQCRQIPAGQRRVLDLLVPHLRRNLLEGRLLTLALRPEAYAELPGLAMRQLPFLGRAVQLRPPAAHESDEFAQMWQLARNYVPVCQARQLAPYPPGLMRYEGCSHFRGCLLPLLMFSTLALHGDWQLGGEALAVVVGGGGMLMYYYLGTLTSTAALAVMAEYVEQLAEPEASAGLWAVDPYRRQDGG